jgi:hypothetical protein
LIPMRRASAWGMEVMFFVVTVDSMNIP